MYPMNRMYRTLLATVALAFSSVAASAETITVCASGCDYTSINAAIGAASDGDIIQLAAETYFEGSQIDTLGKAITLRGVLDRAGDPASVLDGGGTHRVLICQSGETAETVFENLVIQNGYSDFYGGGMYNVGASPTLANCTFEGNSADNGGGMYNELGTATLVGCVFLNNSAIRDGGGVYNLGGNIVATDSIFEANSAGLNAGGVVLVGGVSTFDACEFFANSSTAGGAIYANDFSVVTIRNSVIRGNTTITDGGGLFAYTATVRFEQCQIQENSAGRGGAAFNLASSVVLEATFACDNGVDQFYGGYDDLGANCVAISCDDCDLSSTISVCASGCDYTSINAAIGAASDGDIIQLAAETYFEGSQIDTLGKAITLRGVLDRAGDPASVLDGGGTHRVLICQSGETAETVFENLVIQNGYSDFYGGGMYNVGASPTLANCTFEGNSADNGGGMYNELGTATLVGCVFLNNSAIRDGGGVYNLGGNIVATDSIFEANSAGLNAGGVVLVGGVSTFDACEFFANSSTAGGAIYANDFSVVTIRNSVIRGNTTITDGGGLFAYTATVRFEQCQIQENSAGRGGAAFNLASSVVLEATFACDNGVDQFYGGYDDLGANCVSEECGDDLDGNGIPDTCEPCLGDITGNGVVDAADLGILLALWNTDGKSAPEADINGDGTVNAADLGLLLGAWGPCP